MLSLHQYEARWFPLSLSQRKRQAANDTEQENAVKVHNTKETRTNDICEHDWNMKAVTEDINGVRFFTLNVWKQAMWTLSKHLLVPQKNKK